jgi:hypothetical protein
MPYDREAMPVFAPCMPRARRDIKRALRARSGTKARDAKIEHQGLKDRPGERLAYT